MPAANVVWYLSTFPILLGHTISMCNLATLIHVPILWHGSPSFMIESTTQPLKVVALASIKNALCEAITIKCLLLMLLWYLSTFPSRLVHTDLCTHFLARFSLVHNPKHYSTIESLIDFDRLPEAVPAKLDIYGDCRAFARFFLWFSSAAFQVLS